MKHLLLMGLTLSVLSFGSVAMATEASKADAGPIDFKMESDTIEITAIVKEVDHKNRIITIEGPEGNLLTTTVDDDVQNFNKIKKGDKVDIELYESVAFLLEKNDPKKDVIRKTTKITWNGVTKKKKPVKVETEKIQQIVDVDKVNKQKSTITVTGIKGVPVEVKVKDPKNLEGIEKGDQIGIEYNKMIAVDVRRK